VERVAAGNVTAGKQVAALANLLAMPLAARSSAVGEDGAAASFAGQHATKLGITSEEALVQAVREVAASAHTPAALAYRARFGIAGRPRMGVVVQQLVSASVAGVMFTQDPVSGARELVIEASWGLGEIVVSGEVVPDRYRIARSGAVIERCAGQKDIAVHVDPRGATVRRSIEPAEASRLCLTDAHLAELVTLANRCDGLMGAPADIEWAFRDQQLLVLQMRPLTRTVAANTKRSDYPK
jgi:pyruvate,water dikinase